MAVTVLKLTLIKLFAHFFPCLSILWISSQLMRYHQLSCIRVSIFIFSNIVHLYYVPKAASVKLEHEVSGLFCLKSVQNVCVISFSQQLSAASRSPGNLKVNLEEVFLKEILLTQYLDI